jgi:hypothetical protein
MTREEAIDIAKTLTALRGFPRGDAGAAIVADCATILEDSCQDATRAQALVSQFTPRKWPGVPAFRSHVKNPTEEARQLAALGASYRPTEQGSPVELYPGFPVPAWVFPPEASDAEIGRNVLKYSDELHAAALTIVHKDLDRRQRKAVLELADRGAAVDCPRDNKLDYPERFACAREFRASLYMIEIQGWATRDGVDWKAYFWHYIDVLKWFSHVGEPGIRPYPKMPTPSTKAPIQ